MLTATGAIAALQEEKGHLLDTRDLLGQYVSLCASIMSVFGTSRFAQESSSRRRRRTEREEQAGVFPKVPTQSIDIFGSYSNESNPFGDPSLQEVFVWHKKYEKELAEGKRTHIPSTAEIEAERLSRAAEIAAVKHRQLGREAERRERMRLRAEEERLREAEGYSGNLDKEAVFHLSQTAQRTEIRIRDAREKLVDVLAKNLVVWARAHEEEKAQAAGQSQSTLANPLSKGVDGRNHMLDVVIEAPHQVLEEASVSGMHHEQLQELLGQVQQYVASEELAAGGTDGHGVFLAYWQCVGVLVEDALQRALARSKGDGSHSGPGGVPAAVAPDVEKILGNKSLQELLALEAEVKQRAVMHLGGAADVPLSSAASGVGGADGQFWVHALTAIGVYKAQARAKQLHDKILLLRLGQLRRAKAVLTAEGSAAASKSISAAQSRVGTQSSLADDEETPETPLSGNSAAVPDGMSVAAAAAAGLGDQEEAGGGDDCVEVATPQQHAWQARFKPRKPRFFHRVKTGWAWNKYNRAHYDKDTPPPKVVQGYKFTVFYPELINKFDTPTYHLEPADSPDFAIIRFHAGPPYQDIAFKIVNREWNVQPKQGFKCQFDKGVMQLWFQFKRDSYRR